MPELILCVHCFHHDATAAVYEDYSLRAAVQLERLTRYKGDGREHPDLAIDEVLEIVGATRKDVDVVCLSRGLFPFQYLRKIRWGRWLVWQYWYYTGKHTRRFLIQEILRYQTTKVDDVFDGPRFLRDGGFREDARLFFHNHHEAHALAPLF